MQTASKNKKGIVQRKLAHIEIVLKEDVEKGSNGFEKYKFVHNALPEINFDEIDTSIEFLGKKMRAPILISCMTGGVEHGLRINRNLAKAAQKLGLAMGVGSQRIAIEKPETANLFLAREAAPDIPLIANLGAVQLNYDYGVEEAQKAVDMVDADALALHLNPLQEAIQPEGNRNFAGILEKIETVNSQLSVPLIIKEVGCGISKQVAFKLRKAGIRIVDTAGYGGTNWPFIEGIRGGQKWLGERFSD